MSPQLTAAVAEVKRIWDELHPARTRFLANKGTPEQRQELIALEAEFKAATQARNALYAVEP